MCGFLGFAPIAPVQDKELYLSNSELLKHIGKVLKRAVPVANYHGIFPLSKQQHLEWSLLDTFDMLSPTYDNPQNAQDVKTWFGNHKFLDIECVHAGHLVVRGKKPK